MLKKICIIGNGPAGISAALYTQRARINTTIIGNAPGALQKAELIQNYYGLPTPVTGLELVQNGISQATAIGATYHQEEVLNVQYLENFLVTTTQNTYPADAVILATGTSRVKSTISGIQEFEGKGVSYCAVCDAFFYKNKHVAVLGGGDYAISEAKELSHVAATVTILTDGETSDIVNNSEAFPVNTKKITALTGDTQLKQVSFSDQTTLDVDGLFVAIGTASSTDLAKKLGLILADNRYISVDANMATNIPGLFAAGDCTGGMLQIVKAAYEGAQAAFSAIKFLRS